MSITDVLPADAGLAIKAVGLAPDLIALALESTHESANCPACGAPSDRVHSHYTRTVADLPWRGRQVILRLTVRRFRRRTARCTWLIFCERLPAVLAPHARTTGRLTEAHTALRFALGGETGRRLVERLAVPTNGDTLLRTGEGGPAPRPAYTKDSRRRRLRIPSAGVVRLDPSRPGTAGSRRRVAGPGRRDPGGVAAVTPRGRGGKSGPGDGVRPSGPGGGASGDAGRRPIPPDRQPPGDPRGPSAARPPQYAGRSPDRNPRQQPRPRSRRRPRRRSNGRPP